MAAIAGTSLAAWAGDDNSGGRVPKLDHVFVLVLENHNSFTSFGSPGILDNPNAPHIQALAKKYNSATNYNAVWHPSLPNYVAMITGDWIGNDAVATDHTYPPNSTVGISDDDSPTVATDYPPPANASVHRWRVNLPSLAGQLTAVGKDWRAYMQNIPDAGTTLANWPGDNNTAKMYAVKHNPFPYVAEIQDDPAQFAKQVPLEQLFSDLGAKTVPAFSYIVPDQCRDMHGLSNVLAPCGGVNDTDPVDVKRGDEETFWIVNGILGSAGWKEGRNALFVTFDEGNGPNTCNYSPDTPITDVVPDTLLPGPDCYDPKNFNDKVVMIVITNYGTKGVVDNHFYDHYSLLKTIEAAFSLPFIGHARDPGTQTMSPLLQPKGDDDSQ
jgi:phospholipase C